MLTHSDRTKITSNGKEVAWFRCRPAKCHTSLLMVEIVPLLKRRPPFPHLIKKRRFFTKYHFLKGRKCSVFGFGLSLIFSHFTSCDKFVISCKSCKTRVVCFCFGHSLNPLFLLWSDFREVLNVLLILGILTSEMV